jgi:hypothetical protein
MHKIIKYVAQPVKSSPSTSVEDFEKSDVFDEERENDKNANAG